MKTKKKENFLLRENQSLELTDKSYVFSKVRITSLKIHQGRVVIIHRCSCSLATTLIKDSRCNRL